MSAVIKSTQAAGSGRVRALGVAAPEAAPLRIDAEKTRLRAEVERLAQDLEASACRIQRLEAEADRAFEAGRSAGFDAGRKEGDTLRADSLALLKAGIESALVTVARNLTSLEGLSVALARASLAKLIGENADRQSLVTALLLHQLKDIKASSVLRLEVSKADFPDPQALDALSDASEVPLVQIVAESTLDPGDCRIRLSLGTLEVGLGQQWGELNSLLAGLAVKEPAHD